MVIQWYLLLVGWSNGDMKNDEKWYYSITAMFLGYEIIGICDTKLWHIILVGGIPTPLKNDGVRQLGWWFSTVSGKSFKIPWFQSPPTRSYDQCLSPYTYAIHKPTKPFTKPDWEPDFGKAWGPGQFATNISIIQVLRLCTGWSTLLGGWPTRLKNDGVRQLGWWHSQLFLESHSKFHGSSHQSIGTRVSFGGTLW